MLFGQVTSTFSKGANKASSLALFNIKCSIVCWKRFFFVLKWNVIKANGTPAASAISLTEAASYPFFANTLPAAFRRRERVFFPFLFSFCFIFNAYKFVIKSKWSINVLKRQQKTHVICRKNRDIKKRTQRMIFTVSRDQYCCQVMVWNGGRSLVAHLLDRGFEKF